MQMQTMLRVIEIDMSEIKEPILACPNDPDDVKFLSEVSGEKIDEVFIGSCMTNIGHFRAAGQVLQGKKDMPTRLWVAPPTKMDANDSDRRRLLRHSGSLRVPAWKLLAAHSVWVTKHQIRKGSTAVSTSTRNFPNRLGIDTRVYLASAELSAVAALLGRYTNAARIFDQVESLNAKAWRSISLHEL